MADLKLNTTNGSVTLKPEDGSGNVDVTIPRTGVGKVLNISQQVFGADTRTSSTSYINACTFFYTPVSNNSTLYCDFTLHVRNDRISSYDARGSIRVTDENSSLLYEATEIGSYDRGGSGIWEKYTWSIPLSLLNTSISTKEFNVDMKSQGGEIALNVYGTSPSTETHESYLKITEVAN